MARSLPLQNRDARGWAIVARVLSEGDNHPMEDACGLAGDAAWVVDGATSVLPPLGLPGSSDPGWYAAELSGALATVASGQQSSGQQASQCAASGVRDTVGQALRILDHRAEELVGPERIRFPSAALSVAQLSRSTTGELTGVEVLSLADCHVVVREAATGAVHHIVSVLADPGLSLGASSLETEQLAQSRRRRNTPVGLWVARREAEAAEHALVTSCGVPELIVLASDGAWRAVDLGLVSGPGEFLAAVASPVAALELQTALRRRQAEIGEKADDATVLVLAVR
ncbi:hypothetical protein [Psychromicrobium xiongbiense]|uniref:hypothetical protein n=1 Tax=Psychromicrobium xiongbiense TaxID=3051184 RepID=UPI002552FD21|nr:hypothetical protein [Psychromicrobium sp. YIM S02556]